MGRNFSSLNKGKRKGYLKHHSYLKENKIELRNNFPLKNYNKGEKKIPKISIITYSTMYLYMRIAYIVKKKSIR